MGTVVTDTLLWPPVGSESAFAVGIDVGGTKIAGAIVDLQTGAITARRQVATHFERGGIAVLAKVAGMATALTDEAMAHGATLKGLGVGVPELVDAGGTVFSDYRIAWKDLDIQTALSQILPTRLQSDVRAAALAEARYGAGRQWRDFLYVTIGTGISAVSVRDGQPYAGAHGAALVIANGPTRHHCPVCGHRSEQVLEDIASGPGLASAFGVETAEEVLAAAEAEDERAMTVIDHAAGELGSVVALLVNSLDPAAVIVGGGLGSAPGRYWTALNAAITAGLWSGFDRQLSIVQAQLGADAGLIGAAAILSDQANQQDYRLQVN